MKKLFLRTDQLIDEWLSQYDWEFNDYDFDEEKSPDGRVIGVRINRTDGRGNIVTGYEEIWGVWGDKFYPTDYDDGKGGSYYAQSAEEVL